MILVEKTVKTVNRELLGDSIVFMLDRLSKATGSLISAQNLANSNGAYNTIMIAMDETRQAISCIEQA